MANLFSSKRKKKQRLSNRKNSTAIINTWMSDDYKIKCKKQEAPPEPSIKEEDGREKLVVIKNNPRTDTGILKQQIAAKLKTYK